MGKDTRVPWAHHTFNPWWGCVQISEECENCYAKAWDARTGGAHWGPRAGRRTFTDKHWAQPLRWDRAAGGAGERHRVFCASMADVFEVHDDPVINERIERLRARLWALIRETPHLDWLLLTKRPENFWKMLPWYRPHERAAAPWHNVWLGVSAGNQPRWDERVPLVMATSAARRIVSYEPALGPLDITPRGYDGQVDGIFAGDESGPKARPPAPLDWYRSVRDQCRRDDVAFFLKQFVRDRVKLELPKLDGRRHADFPTPYL